MFVCFLAQFAYSMGVIFLTQLVLAILAFVFSHEVQSRVTTVLETQAIRRYRDDPDLKNLVDWLQLTVLNKKNVNSFMCVFLFGLIR